MISRTLVQSRLWQKRSDDVIAGGALTNSKRPACFVQGVYPTHIASGLGALVWDVDGNQYVDYICGLGSQLFGYRNQKITKSVMNQLDRNGTIFSLGTTLEVWVAEQFRDRFHFMQKMRFLKTASEACSAAIRIARSFTGKSVILSDGYHGWHDIFTSLTPPANGVRDVHLIQKLHESIEWGEVAAIIVEPVIVDDSIARLEYLRRLKDLCAQNGTLLIFDETITCLRYPKLSVSSATGIDPDLTIMGKAIGGGYPLALVGGRRDVMSAEFFVSSTFAGDCVALAAADAVLALTREPGVMENLQLQAAKFCERFNKTCEGVVSIKGYGTRGTIEGPELFKALFMQECVKAGILFGPSFFYGTEHHKHDEDVLSICKVVTNRIKNKEVSLEGLMPVKPYAQKVRE